MPNVDPKSIRLTESVQKGGCAAKLPAGQLRAVLKDLNLIRPESLRVGTEYLDDACVWDLGNGSSLVQTLDFFTPIIDEAYDFGAIAAANALSDIYAMGGTPKIALSILAFPAQTLPLELLRPLMEGALSKVHEAGACLAGGHTIDDETLKFGLSVTGFVNSKNVWANSGAKPGDALILTKCLGTGTITSALKRREAKDEWVTAAIDSMKQLNRTEDLLDPNDVHAATDITGFGLAGHALQMARASGVRVHVNINAVPQLPGTLDCLEKRILNRAHRTNLEYVQEEARFDGLTELQKWLAVDPQTSGGLLLSVANEKAAEIAERLRSRFPHAKVIGRVETSSSPAIIFEADNSAQG